MNHGNQLFYDSDDDDYIAIKEHKGQSLVAAEPEESQVLSPTQNPIPQRRHRRRQQRPQSPAQMNRNRPAVSQTIFPNGGLFSSSAIQSAGVSAFKSLESLLEDQALSLSLTQESVREETLENAGCKYNDERKDNDEMDHPAAMQVEQVEPMESRQQHMPPPRQPFAQENLEPNDVKMTEASFPYNNNSPNESTTNVASNRNQIHGEKKTHNNDYKPPMMDQENSNNNWMDTTDSNQDYSSYALTCDDYNPYNNTDERNDSLEKELKRRRKSVKETKKKKAAHESPAILEDSLRPTQSLQHRLKRERQNRRSNKASADRTLQQHPYKRDRSARSTSPRLDRPSHPHKKERSTRSNSPRPSQSRSKSPHSRRRQTSSSKVPVPIPMEKAANSLVGFRYVVCGCFFLSIFFIC